MWLGVALATKPQAILVAPVIVGVMARRVGARGRSLAWMILGAGLAAVVTMSPFISRGAVRNVMLAVATAATHDALSAYAANVWWIVTWIGRASIHAANLGWPTALFQKVQVHENHLYLALPFFALAAALDERFRLLFWAFSAADGLNLALFYGLGGDIPFPSRVWGGFDLSVLLALANLGLFVWITYRASRCAPCSAR